MADALQSRRVPGMAMGQQDLHLDVLTPLEALSPDDAAATLFHCLGIDHQQEYHTNTGRPVMIVRDGHMIPQHREDQKQTEWQKDS